VLVVCNPMNTDFVACTIVAHNYLPQARILAESFKRHHPESTFYIVIVDRPIEARLVKNSDFIVIPITDVDFGDEGFEYMAAIYDVTEFATSVKPFALRQLTQSHDCVFYIDPDIEVFAPLTPLVEKTVEVGWSLTPHSVRPIIRNGWQPTEQEIKGAGIYNLGYVGVTKRADAFLEWWCERLRRDSVVDVPNQLFTDQRWIDMAVAIFPVHVERTTSYNVAYWNLDQRKLWKNVDTYMVDDDVLRFFHFSGYDPLSPHWISKYQNGRPRVLLSDNHVLAELCEHYGEKLLGIRDEIVSSTGYGWRNIVPGVPFTKALRRYLRDTLVEAELDGSSLPPTPFGDSSSEKFVKWVREPSSISGTKLPRYLDAIYKDRHDLQHFFPEVVVGEHHRFFEWCDVQGKREEPLIRAFGVPKADITARMESVVVESNFDNGINIIGYLDAELGVGEAARLAIKALNSAEVPVSTITYSKTISRQNLSFKSDNTLKYRPLLMAVNADQIEVCQRELGIEAITSRYIIGQWFWELEEFPDHYQRSFDFVDELWAPTEFIANCLRAKAPKKIPIHHMSLPLLKPEIDPSFRRQRIGLDNQFMFLFTFDFFSVAKRKNPVGVIDAYCRAFPVQNDTVLVLKTINGHHRLNELEKLRWHARKRSDILIVDEYFSPQEVAGLMASADAYISLHRSEGLGLTMAESMLLGTPVIATGYSGNLDFMNDQNSILIPWKKAKVGSGADSYSPDAYWAEPSIEHAADAMKRLVDDRKFAIRLGQDAQEDLLSRFSVEVTGERMKSRLEKIWSNQSGL
jgi:glycosyltransferase involved in cell wall biosynthesis